MNSPRFSIMPWQLTSRALQQRIRSWTCWSRNMPGWFQIIQAWSPCSIRCRRWALAKTLRSSKSGKSSKKLTQSAISNWVLPGQMKSKWDYNSNCWAKTEGEAKLLESALNMQQSQANAPNSYWSKWCTKSIGAVQRDYTSRILAARTCLKDRTSNLQPKSTRP